jgi:tight adherence protein B
VSRAARIGPLLAALAAIVALALAAAPAQAVDATGTTGPRLTETASSSFPAKSYVLSLPEPTELTPESLTVLENGEPVLNLELTLPGNDGVTTFGVVLLIDASNSMEGDPIEQAMAAAREFALELTEGIQVSVVLFNNEITTLVPLTEDVGAVASAVSTAPELAFGTRMYDALAAAEEQLAGAAIDVRSILLLSDGNDIGSEATLQETLEQVSDDRTRIFSVGLESSQFEEAPLRSLATASGGTFALASSPEELTAVFRSIGETISSDYVLTYDSFAGPSEDVNVVVKVPGQTQLATATYTTPALPGGASTELGLWDRVIQSQWTALAVALLAAALIGFGTYLLVRRRDRSVERRLGQYVTLPLEEQARLRKQDVRTTLAEHEAISPIHRSLRELAFYKRLKRDVELARIRVSAGMIVALTAVATVVFAIAGWLLLGAWGLFAALIPTLVARWYVARQLRSLRAAFADQLPETLDVVSSALRAGHSLTGALTVAVDGAPEPSRSELGRAMSDEQLGVALDDALRVVAHRMDSRDLMQVALVAQLQREAGTNAAEVIDQVSTNIRNRLELQRLVRTLTAQGRMSRWIVSLLPFLLFIAIFFLNRNYLRPLWETNAGTAALIAAVAMIVAGSLVIKKIVEIEV